ncbi:hypothetical protein F4780DRAFT_713101 [Xylariomycetidae sp. FL0641]|nr:hypothetical protein F4780DRAFT_713101 [Xylariomycetidae sp. FL0641]
MGDASATSAPGSDYASPEPLSSSYQGLHTNDGHPTLPPGPSPVNNPAFQAQYQQLYGPSPNAFSNQLDMAHGHGSGRQGPYNMASMANALPQAGYRPSYVPGQQQQHPHHQQQQQPRFSHSPAQGMIPQMHQFQGQPGISPVAGQHYYVAQHPQMSPYYNAPLSPTSQQHQPTPRANVNMAYYPNSIVMNQTQHPMAAAYYYPSAASYAAPNAGGHGQMSSAPFVVPDGPVGAARVSSPLQRNENLGAVAGFGQHDESADSRSNVVRGPPRKPRQSGHAIWIGNLPPQTDLMNLVHHVCEEAGGLESLFLISKSNCAFANFRDEASCVAAQQKLHDSKFQSVRLVSRLRKSTVEGTSGQTAPTGPAATSPNVQSVPSEPKSSSNSKEAEPTPPTPENSSEPKNPPTNSASTHKDKFFILKSLTVEDLDLSVRNGVWATQSHNEQTLNKAFKEVDNVYLVFSANKSGEYFGYARMISAINDDPAAAIEFAPKAQATSTLDLPKAIPTEATESCPRGRIIDDSARGTIFWEVERDDTDGILETESEDSASVKSGPDGEGSAKAWGKPFKLEWLSTTRLPFYRTRGLRNPWNSNREVKIARDGTELEPSIGRRLIGLFNRIQSPAPLAMGMRPPIPLTAGYPPPMPPSFRS